MIRVEWGVYVKNRTLERESFTVVVSPVFRLSGRERGRCKMDVTSNSGSLYDSGGGGARSHNRRGREVTQGMGAQSVSSGNRRDFRPPKSDWSPRDRWERLQYDKVNESSLTTIDFYKRSE